MPPFSELLFFFLIHFPFCHNSPSHIWHFSFSLLLSEMEHAYASLWKVLPLPPTLIQSIVIYCYIIWIPLFFHCVNFKCLKLSFCTMGPKELEFVKVNLSSKLYIYNLIDCLFIQVSVRFPREFHKLCHFNKTHHI